MASELYPHIGQPLEDRTGQYIIVNGEVVKVVSLHSSAHSAHAAYGAATEEYIANYQSPAAAYEPIIEGRVMDEPKEKRSTSSRLTRFIAKTALTATVLGGLYGVGYVGVDWATTQSLVNSLPGVDKRDNNPAIYVNDLVQDARTKAATIIGGIMGK